MPKTSPHVFRISALSMPIIAMLLMPAIASADCTINNSTITGSTGQAAITFNTSQGCYTNQSLGNLIGGVASSNGPGGDGVDFLAGTALTNSGNIAGGMGNAQESGGLSVNFQSTGGVLINNAGGVITGGGGINNGNGGDGIEFGAGTTLTNMGTISGGGGSTTGIAGTGVIFDTFEVDGTLINSGSIIGGRGMSGGDGIVFFGGIALTNTGSIVGGEAVGSNDVGGVGIFLFEFAPKTLTNSGVISGGAGTGGAAGGVGILAHDATIINSGTISGGISGDTQADAIIFNIGANILELQAGSIINGIVLVTNGATGTLQLGGTGNSSFDLSTIDTGSLTQQYQGFTAYTKTGSSTWTLTNSTTQTNPWVVNAGTLMLGTSMQSTANLVGDMTVNTGGTFGGFGHLTTVTNGLQNLGGTVSPGFTTSTLGASVLGTLTLTGNYSQSSTGTYLVDISNTGGADILVVNGSAQLDGTVVVNPLNNGFNSSANYTILSATQGFNNTTFSNVDINGIFNQGFLTGQLVYVDLFTEEKEHDPLSSSATRTSVAAQAVVMQLAYRGEVFAQSAQTPNQQSVSNYILATGGTTAVQYLMSVLNPNDPQSFQTALDQISGATYANENIALAHMGGLFADEVGSRLGQFNTCNEAESINKKSQKKINSQHCQGDKTIWMTLQSGDDQLSPGAVSGLNSTYDNLMMGVELPLGERTTAGFGFAYNDFQGNATGGVENAYNSGQLIQLGVYGRYQLDNWLVGLSADAGTTDNFNTQRNIQGAAGLVGVSGNRSANVFSQQLRASYDLTPQVGFSLQPFVGFINQQVNASSFNETGGTGFELGVDSSSYYSARSQLGITLAAPDINAVQPFASLSWEHEFANTQSSIDAQLTGLDGQYGPSAAFNVVSTPMGSDIAVIDAGLVLFRNKTWEIAAGYEGRFTSNWQANAGTLQANLSLN